MVDPDGVAQMETILHRLTEKLREKEEKLLPHSAVTVAHGHLLIASHRDFLERVLATTAADGTYSLSLDPGKYVVVEVTKSATPAWHPRSCACRARSVTSG